MSMWKVLGAGFGALMVAAAAALSPVAASAAPVDGRAADIAPARARAAVSAVDPVCLSGWRRLRYGDTGLHGVVEPGSPYHVRLGTDTNGFQNFRFCSYGRAQTGDLMMSFEANGHQGYHLTYGATGMVSATGDDGLASFWYVCALDAKWAEIRWWSDKADGGYMSRRSGYMVTRGGAAGGDVLWRAEEFAGIALPHC